MIFKIFNLFLYINKYIKTVILVTLFASSNIVISKSEYENYLNIARGALTVSIYVGKFHQDLDYCEKNPETSSFVELLTQGFWSNTKMVSTNPSFFLLQALARDKDVVNNEILGTEKITSPKLENLIIKIFSELDINPEDIKLRAISAESCYPMLNTGQSIWGSDNALWLNQDYLMNRLTLVEREAVIAFHCCLIKHYSFKKVVAKAIAIPAVTATVFYGLSYLVGEDLNNSLKNNFNISDSRLAWATAWAPYVGAFVQMYINQKCINKTAFNHIDSAFDTYASKYDLLVLRSYFQKMLDIIANSNSALSGGNFEAWIDKIDNMIENRASKDNTSNNANDLIFNS